MQTRLQKFEMLSFKSLFKRLAQDLMGGGVVSIFARRGCANCFRLFLITKSTL